MDHSGEDQPPSNASTNDPSAAISLEEENQQLKAKVKALEEQLAEKDGIIATLELQVKTFIKSAESFHTQIPNDSTSKDYDDEREEKIWKEREQKAAWKAKEPGKLPPMAPKFSTASSVTLSTIEPPRSVVLSDQPNVSDEASLSLASTTSSRPPLSPRRNQTSVSPPRRRHDCEESDSNNRSDLASTSTSGSLVPSQLVDTGDDEPGVVSSSTILHGNKTLVNTNESNKALEKEDGYRKSTFNKTNGTIKALPRELSIFNSDDDDVTKYSNEKPPIFTLQKSEMRDAYNARGIYTGSISRASQMPHGKGKMEYHHQGRSYDGDWVQGHWHGKGIIKNANGDVYEGDVVNDLREGQGKIWYVDGRVFEGRFSQDDPVHGTVHFADGAQYTGELHNETRHGYGIYHFTDNSCYEGYSVMNVFEGKGKMTWSDGGWYEGDWQGGEIHGFGVEVRPDGSIRHKGRWSKGIPIRSK